MKLILFLSIVCFLLLWLSFEVWRSPLLDDNYRVIRKEKTFKDLIKKLKLWK